jgi:tripeptidyl-peptidase-1
MKVGTFLSLLVTGVVALDQHGAQRQQPLSSSWTVGNKTPDQQLVNLVFSVKEDLPTLSATVDELSDPDSPKYGQWLSLDEVNARFTDHKARTAVKTYLVEQGVAFEEVSPGFFAASMPAAKANTMLGADFRVHIRKDDALTIHRSKVVTLPASVSWAVDAVEYATRTPAQSTAKVFMSKFPNPSGDANPKIIQEYYGITNPVVKNKQSTNCVFETIGQSIVQADVAAFDKQYNIPPQRFTIIGPNDPSSCANVNNCVESTLDVQVITANAQDNGPNDADLPGKSITTFWSVPGTESFLQWILAVSKDPHPPWVHSISYGEPEPDTGRQQDDSFDKALQKIALRGVSVLVASGDDGVAGSQARGTPGACGFNPSYPASATHVTAVGATMGPETGSEETACTSTLGGGITSGGGFSTIFNRPQWQDQDVEHYLRTSKNLPSLSLFNSTMRAYPDVATMGHNYPIVIGGSTYHGSGTSASSPLMAAMITLINDARISAGKRTLGWLNPALYKLKEGMFHNITKGENNCAAGSSPQGPRPATCCQYGFTDQAGWSPITGLGSPVFPKLLKNLVNLP